MQKRSSTKILYINLTKEETNTLSEKLKSQKKKRKEKIDNRKDKLNNKTIELLKPENEVECIAKYLEKEDSFVESFYLLINLQKIGHDLFQGLVKGMNF